jgi:hypothetical protein
MDNIDVRGSNNNRNGNPQGYTLNGCLQIAGIGVATVVVIAIESASMVAAGANSVASKVHSFVSRFF